MMKKIIMLLALFIVIALYPVSAETLTVQVNDTQNNALIAGFCGIVSNSSFTTSQCTLGTSIDFETGEALASTIFSPLNISTQINGSTIDYSGNGKDAALQNFELANGTAIGGTVLSPLNIQFDGVDDSITLGPDHNTWWGNNATTVMIKYTFGNQSGVGFLFSSDDDSVGSFSVFIASDQDVFVKFGGSSNSQIGGLSNNPGDEIILTVVWFNSSHAKYYVNGTSWTPDPDDTETPTNWASNIDVIFGDDANGGNNVNGTIHWAKVWNRTLNSTEIAEENNSNFVINSEGIVYSTTGSTTSGVEIGDEHYLVNQSNFQAYSFDGIDDSVNYKTADIVPANSSITLSADVFVRSSPENRFISRWYGSNFRSRSGSIRFKEVGGFSFYVRNSSGSEVRLDSGVNTKNDWVSVTAVWDQVTCFVGIYTDGVLRNSSSVCGESISDTDTPRLGFSVDSSNNYFNGSLRNFRVFERALSSSEVLQLFNGQFLSIGTYDIIAHSVGVGTGSTGSYSNGTFEDFSFLTTTTATLNSTQNFVNISFFDESNLSLLVGVNVTVLDIAPSGVTTVFSTITGNVLINGSLEQGDHVLRYSAPGYSTRDYPITIGDENQFSANLYLLLDTVFSPGTVRVLNFDGLPRTGAVVTMFRFFGANSQLIQEGITNNDGEIVMVAESVSAQYSFVVTVDGVVRFTDPVPQLLVLDSDGLWSKNIILDATKEENTSRNTGFSHSFRPQSPINNGSAQTFLFRVNSTEWDITACTLTLSFASSGSVISTTSGFCSASTGSGSIGYTPISNAQLLLTATVATDEFTNTYIQTYSVFAFSPGNFTLKNLADDLDGFSGAGFEDFARMLVAIIVIIGFTYAVRSVRWLNNPEEILLLMFMVSLGFSYINWLTLNIESIPVPALKQWFISILLGLASLVASFRKMGVGQ